MGCVFGTDSTYSPTAVSILGVFFAVMESSVCLACKTSICSAYYLFYDAKILLLVSTIIFLSKHCLNLTKKLIKMSHVG